MRTAVSPATGARRQALSRILRSFGYAVEGFVSIVRTQPNFSVHLVAAAGALGAGVALRVTTAELAELVLVIGLVLVAESLNTAIETLCDLVSPAPHPLVKRAKDVAAAGVLVSAIVAVGVGLAILGPRLLDLVARAAR